MSRLLLFLALFSVSATRENRISERVAPQITNGYSSGLFGQDVLTPSTSLSCSNCYDQLYWYLPPLAHHKFGGNANANVLAPAVVGEEGTTPAEDEASYVPAAGREWAVITSNGHGGDNGDWLNGGSKDCQAFNACHSNEQAGYCHESHYQCQGMRALEIAFQLALESGSLGALFELAASHPDKVKMIGSRGVAQLLGCGGGLVRQEVFARVTS